MGCRERSRVLPRRGSTLCRAPVPQSLRRVRATKVRQIAAMLARLRLHYGGRRERASHGDICLLSINSKKTDCYIAVTAREVQTVIHSVILLLNSAEESG